MNNKTEVIIIKTYQDLQAVGENEALRMQFVHGLIGNRGEDELYRTAKVAEQYRKHRNKTINDFQKLLYTATGKVMPDNYSSNYKLASRFFNRFLTQENQYLLGNGVTWAEKSTADVFGDDFDNVLQKIGKNALCHGLAFGFYNMDHVESFDLLHFAPLWDEEDGALKAGVRHWQIDAGKPLRATLYELDGYTDYMWDDGEGKVLHEKRPYILKTISSPADGEMIYEGVNYPGFPIVPMWGNPEHQSELVGLREQIDCYDLIKSGFANTVDDASLIYWTIQNAGGMDDVDMAQFLERIRKLHIATADDDAQATPTQLEAPYASREALLDRLRSDLYEDAMALDIKNIADGAVTATQIEAAYEPLNSKTDDYEYCVLDFLQGLMAVAGVEDKPSFTRSKIVNVSEGIQTIIQAGDSLSEEYKTEKILTMLGDGDRVEEVLAQLGTESYERLNASDLEDEQEQPGENGAENGGNSPDEEIVK